jgi:hypothetical protein
VCCSRGEGMGSTGVALRASWKETLHPFHVNARKPNVDVCRRCKQRLYGLSVYTRKQPEAVKIEAI